MIAPSFDTLCLVKRPHYLPTPRRMHLTSHAEFQSVQNPKSEIQNLKSAIVYPFTPPTANPDTTHLWDTA